MASQSASIFRNLPYTVHPWMCISIPLLFGGCAPLNNGLHWGRDVTFFPGLREIDEAFIEAIDDPYMWILLACGTIILMTGYDRDISDWTSDNGPLFGSRERAMRVSDDLEVSAEIGWIVTMLLTDSGEGMDEIIPAKLKGAGTVRWHLSIHPWQ